MPSPRQAGHFVSRWSVWSSMVGWGSCAMLMRPTTVASASPRLAPSRWRLVACLLRSCARNLGSESRIAGYQRWKIRAMVWSMFHTSDTHLWCLAQGPFKSRFHGRTSHAVRRISQNGTRAINVMNPTRGSQMDAQRGEILIGLDRASLRRLVLSGPGVTSESNRGRRRRSVPF